MRHANDTLNKGLLQIFLGAFLFYPFSLAVAVESQRPPLQCQKPIYLTLDTGHMGMAPLIADVLRKHQVPATFFGAHEKTQEVTAALASTGLHGGRREAVKGTILQAIPTTMLIGDQISMPKPSKFDPVQVSKKTKT